MAWEQLLWEQLSKGKLNFIQILPSRGKTMKNRSSKTILVFFALGLISCAFCVQQAQAVPVTGAISFGGDFAPNTGDLNTATSISFSSFIFATSVSGSYSSVPTFDLSLGIIHNSVTFDPFTAPVTPLWSFSYLGLTYSFDLLSLTFDRGPDTLTLDGSGTLKISGGGYDDTPGSWIMTLNQADGTFSFSSSNGALAAVPDGGMTVVMLGLGLCGIGIIRRKLTK